MAIYHIVLFKVKPGISQTILSEWKQVASSMVGKIPGLQKLDVGPPHPTSSHRAQGYDMGFVAILDEPETIKVYAEHPAHLEVHQFREEICTETLVYDLEYTP